MNTFIVPIIVGALVAIVYSSLLIVPTMGRFSLFSFTNIFSITLGTLVRLSLIALAVYSMLHYSVNHLILMMGMFYIIVGAIMFAYKGVR